MIYLHLQNLRRPPHFSKRIIIAQTVHHLWILVKSNQVCVRICNLGNCGKEALHQIAVVGISGILLELHPLTLDYRIYVTRCPERDYKRRWTTVSEIWWYHAEGTYLLACRIVMSKTHNMVIGFLYWFIFPEWPFTSSLSACTFYYADHGECRLWSITETLSWACHGSWWLSETDNIIIWFNGKPCKECQCA